jgi:hypothetical protein
MATDAVQQAFDTALAQFRVSAGARDLEVELVRSGPAECILRSPREGYTIPVYLPESPHPDDLKRMFSKALQGLWQRVSLRR